MPLLCGVSERVRALISIHAIQVINHGMHFYYPLVRYLEDGGKGFMRDAWWGLKFVRDA